MISVVIPTMWRHEPFCDFLTQVCAQKHVWEVVLIDNAPAYRPTHDVLFDKKIKWINLGTNLFVNPSWNMGVYCGESDIICLQNDDIQFDCDIYQKVAEFIQPHMGLFSLDIAKSDHTQITFEKWQGHSTFGCGQLMFFHKRQFCHIDPELRVYCGDNWLFDHMWHTTKQNYMIKNLAYETPYSVTSREFRPLYVQEHAHYMQVCDKWRITPVHE